MDFNEKNVVILYLPPPASLWGLAGTTVLLTRARSFYSLTRETYESLSAEDKRILNMALDMGILVKMLAMRGEGEDDPNFILDSFSVDFLHRRIIPELIGVKNEALIQQLLDLEKSDGGRKRKDLIKVLEFSIDSVRKAKQNDHYRSLRLDKDNSGVQLEEAIVGAEVTF